MEIEHTSEARIRREDAADRLRALADELSRHNEVSFVRGDKQFTVSVPDEVVFSLEVELAPGDNEIEVELKW